MVIGKNKFNQSWRIKRWAQQSDNRDGHEAQDSPTITTEYAAGDTRDEELEAPLLDGGQELLEPLPAHLKNSYARDFYLADRAFHSGRLEATTRGRKKYWERWEAYTKPLGVDPYLQDTSFTTRMRTLSGFMTRVCKGYFGKGKQVKNCTVSSALTAVGQTIALACNANPTKINGSDKLLPRLQVMLDGYGKEDPATIKKLPVQADVPELLVSTAYQGTGTAQNKAAVDLTMIAFYYLLRVGEYTVKGSRNSTKQTVQFKYEDVTFFRKNNRGQLRCLPRNAPDDLISSADGATLKLDNQKNGWKGVCVYHETNGDTMHCPVRALGRRYLHLRQHNATPKTFLSTFYNEASKQCDITNEDITEGLKRAATALYYPIAKGIPIARIDTHSLRSGGANALSLAGFSDTQIQRWDDGEEPRSKSMYEKNSHHSRKACQQR